MASFFSGPFFLRPPSLSFFSLAGEAGEKKRWPNPNTLITGSTRTLVEYDLSMPLGRGRRAPMPMPMPAPAAAGVLELRSSPRNTTRPDALTRGLSAATAGRRGRAGARGCHGSALELPLPESEEDEEEEETRVRSGYFMGAAGAAAMVGFLDMRWRRLATGAERVRSGGRWRAESSQEEEEVAVDEDEDEEESRERSGRE